MNSRNLYKKVHQIDRINIIPNKRLSFVTEKFSRIISFLTNPLVKNNPVKQNNVIVIWICINIELVFKPPILRLSCWENIECIINPIIRNRHLLKNACLIRWTKDKEIILSPILINNRAIWDKVLKATTFLKSISYKAVKLERKIVILPIQKIVVKLIHDGKIIWNFRSKNTPAVTKVDLWTKEDTGVGALIAFGSHALNGNWALFVLATKIRIILVLAIVIILFVLIPDINKEENKIRIQ